MGDDDQRTMGTMKVLTIVLTVITIVSICIGGANFVMSIKGDIREVKDDVIGHIEEDDKKWDKADKTFDELEAEDKLATRERAELKLNNAVIETRFTQILKEMQAMNHKLDQWEPVEE